MLTAPLRSFAIMLQLANDRESAALDLGVQPEIGSGAKLFFWR